MAPVRNTEAADRVDSNIVYQILMETTPTGASIPLEIGAGRFAKVYKAWQRSDGQNIRQVAIKVLHNTARYSDQDLFDKEIELLKQLSATGKFNGVNILDVVHLGPMIMCSCGQVYHPRCPVCGRHQLQRRESDNKEYPSLACPSGDYEVSAMDIEIQTKRLTSPPAKQCCKEGPRASEGTIINFIDRPAVVMELQQIRLDHVGEHRRTYFDQRALPYLLAAGGGDDTSRFSFAKRRKSDDRDRIKRAMALDRVMLMVQITEAVTWLHHEMNIVHKDLTPDNIMVNFGNDRSAQGQKQSRQPIILQDLLNDMVTYPNFAVKVIDFGLADREKLTHKWYEEKDINNAGRDKSPYFSPEAMQRIQHLNPPLQFDAVQKRFSIPQELWDSNLSVHEGDLVAFEWDLKHDHEMIITRIEQGPQPGTRYAYFDGTPPPPGQQRQMQLILPLGEAHDIYAVGALFYYVLTESHLQVQRLAGFVNAIQTRPCELTAKALKRRHGDGYIAYRDALPIPDPYWRDRVMELILRAMVRGRPESFNRARSERGPEAALELLWETKGVYRGIQEKILSEARVRRFQMAIILIAAVALIATWLALGWRSKAKKPPIVVGGSDVCVKQEPLVPPVLHIPPTPPGPENPPSAPTPTPTPPPAQPPVVRPPTTPPQIRPPPPAAGQRPVPPPQTRPPTPPPKNLGPANIYRPTGSSAPMNSPRK